MVKQGFGRSAHPEIFNAMLSTLLLQKKLFMDQLEGVFGHDVISWGLNVRPVDWMQRCKGLRCRVLSDLELDLLDSVIGSPVCYWESKSFPSLKIINSVTAMFKKYKVPG